jgi:hypothetical protein
LIFRHPPNENPLTDSYEILHFDCVGETVHQTCQNGYNRLAMGAAPHIGETREIYKRILYLNIIPYFSLFSCMILQVTKPIVGMAQTTRILTPRMPFGGLIDKNVFRGNIDQSFPKIFKWSILQGNRKSLITFKW